MSRVPLTAGEAEAILTKAQVTVSYDHPELVMNKQRAAVFKLIKSGLATAEEIQKSQKSDLRYVRTILTWLYKNGYVDRKKIKEKNKHLQFHFFVEPPGESESEEA